MVVVVVVVDVRRSIALARTRLASENQKPSCSESRFWMSASSFGLLRALVVLRPGPRPAPSVMTAGCWERRNTTHATSPTRSTPHLRGGTHGEADAQQRGGRAQHRGATAPLSGRGGIKWVAALPDLHACACGHGRAARVPACGRSSGGRGTPSCALAARLAAAQRGHIRLLCRRADSKLCTCLPCGAQPAPRPARMTTTTTCSRVRAAAARMPARAAATGLRFLLCSC